MSGSAAWLVALAAFTATGTAATTSDHPFEMPDSMATFVERLESSYESAPGPAIQLASKALERLRDRPDAVLEARVRYVLARAVIDIDGNEAGLDHAVAAARAARRVADRRLELRAARLVGDACSAVDRYSTALEFLKRALDLARQLGDHDEEAGVLAKLGNVHARVGSFDRSVELFSSALALAERHGDRRREAHMLNNIGIVHRRLEHFDEALEFYRKALAIKEEIGDDEDIARTLNNIGIVFAETGELERALTWLVRALEIKRRIGEERGIATTLQNIGSVYGEMGESRVARVHLEEALAIFEEVGPTSGVANTLTDLARLNRSTGQLSTALLQAQRAHQLAAEIDAMPLVSGSLGELAHIHEQRGDMAEALRCLRLSREADEAIFSERTSDALAKMQARLDVREKERDIELLNRKREMQAVAIDRERHLRWTAVATVAILGVLVLLLHRANRIKARTHKKLNDAYDELEQLATLDPLTELLNRRALGHRIDDEARRFERLRAEFSIAMADIDHFKNLNDRHGHDVGDAVLVELAKRISGSIRGCDSAGRWGGEEFVLLLPATDLEGGARLAERLRHTIASRPVVVRGVEHRVTVTIGVAVFDGKRDVDACIRAADEAMYAGKRAGRDRVVLDSERQSPPPTRL